MKIEHSFHYPADPDTVVAMLADPQFQERKLAAGKALRHSVSVTSNGAGPVIEVSRTLAIGGGIPELFAKFVKDSVEIRETTEWDAPRGGARSAQVRLAFSGQPMTLRATMTLEPAADGTAGRLRGDLKCGVPLIGGRAEKALAPQVVRELDAEVAAGTAWLSEQD